MSMDKIMEDRKEVVEKIAADIEAGKPLFWESGLTVSGRPRNIMQRSGRASYYRGGNSLRLSFVAMQHGYTDPRWGTFKQVQEMGGRIRKGEKGTHIEYYQFEREVWEKNPKTGKKEPVYEMDADGCMAVKKGAPAAADHQVLCGIQRGTNGGHSPIAESSERTGRTE